MLSCLLLSAGLSQRFGSPKALAKINDKTVIEYMLDRLLQTRVDEIVVVLGAHADQIKPVLFNYTKIKTVYNRDFNLGQMSSVQAGLKNVTNEATAFMLMPVDCPFVEVSTVDALVDRFATQNPLVLIPAFNGRKGHPPLFSCALKEEVLNSSVSIGLNNVFHAHDDRTETLSCNDPGVVETFNTVEEFQKIKKDKELI